MNPLDYLNCDTLSVLRKSYSRREILEGYFEIKTPIFDRLAAETFASDAS